MAQRAIREYDGKQMIVRLLAGFSKGEYTLANKYIQVDPETDLEKIPRQYKWVKKSRLVVKPDQLIKRRGKNKLILLNATWDQTKKWIREHRGKKVKIDGVEGELQYFLIELFVPHKLEDEYYLAIRSERGYDEVLFHHEGGIDVGDIEAKAQRIRVCLLPTFNCQRRIDSDLLFKKMPKSFLSNEKRKKVLDEYIKAIYSLYANCGFTYMEINPLLVSKGKIKPLDLAAKLDDTAAFENITRWNGIEFPPPFGQELTPEEEYIKGLDEKTGSSLKLTIINPNGRIWTMIAGGGASVIYADTISDLGYGEELANYGEYSGDPSEEFTYEYAKTILDLMTTTKDPRGKILLIGGGVANFTDVAKTFKGITKALIEYKEKLKENKVKIYVRRGGPNYKEGLENMRKLGETLGVPIEVYGPETHMTRVVSIALGGKNEKASI